MFANAAADDNWLRLLSLLGLRELQKTWRALASGQWNPDISRFTTDTDLLPLVKILARVGGNLEGMFLQVLCVFLTLLE